MDLYFRKTRRPIQASSTKRKPSSPPPSEVSDQGIKTPENAKIPRPLQPPPIKRKPESTTTIRNRPDRPKPISHRELFKSVHPQSPEKISSGPLKGLSTSLIDIIKAKETARNKRNPELERKQELLGIAPEVVRIVSTVFTASKRNVLPYDKVVEKCFKGLRSNYTSSTIIECLDLLDKVTPEWVSTVVISRGKFMKYNKEKYTLSNLIASINTYKEEKLSTLNK